MGKRDRCKGRKKKRLQIIGIESKKGTRDVE
jgi:hypothetical protein